MGDIRRIHTEEFKRDAVRLATERGSIRATARDLGVSEAQLSRWKAMLTRPSENPFPGNGNPRDPELAKLEREVARLREENAILKKTVGIFVRDPR